MVESAVLSSEPKVQAAGAESNQAVERLLELQTAAYQLAVRVLGPAEGAEDVVQQAYLAALVQIRAGKPPFEERTWFLRLVANKAKDHLKLDAKRRGREASVAAEKRVSPQTSAEEIGLVRQALEGLEEKYRVSVALCCEQGLTQREAAEVLGLPERTVSEHLRAGLERLRKSLERVGFTGLAPATLHAALRETAPSVPVGLEPALAKLVTGALAGVKTVACGSGAKMAAGGLALGWKFAAGISLAAVLAASSVTLWRQRGQPEPVPAEEPGPLPPAPTGEPALQTVLVVPRGSDAKAAFYALQRLGGPRAVMLGLGNFMPLVPSELRFKSVDGRVLIEAVAAYHQRNVAWVRDGKVAVIQRGATDTEVEKVLAGLKSTEPSTRREAAWRAGLVEDVRVLGALAGAVEDADGEVVRQALRSAKRLGFGAFVAVEDAKALTALKRALEDKDASVRRGAASALGQVGGEKALALLEKALQHKDENVRRGAASALGQVGGEKALPLLEKALEDQDANVRRGAAWALGQVGGEKALALLEKALEHKDANVRWRAASALGEEGGPRARAVLLKHLVEEKNGPMLRTIFNALKSSFSGDPEVDRALKAVKLTDEAPPVSAPKPQSPPLAPPDEF